MNRNKQQRTADSAKQRRSRQVASSGAQAGSPPGGMDSGQSGHATAQRKERWETDEEFVESIVQNITGGLLTVDLEKNVTFFNRAAEQMLGRSAAEVVGRPMETVFWPEPGGVSWVLESLHTGQVFHQEETVMLTKAGETLRIGISTAPLRDRSNRIVGVLATFVDLSQVARLREKKARRELLMSLGEMSAVVAHKVRNPLASIKLGMQLLRKDLTRASSLVRQTIELIDQEVDKIERIIEELLNIVHPRDLNMTETDLREVIARALFAVSDGVARKKISVAKEYSLDFAPILADASQLEQVFYSIFSNALDALPVEGRLSIRGANGPNGAVQVEIEDDGDGIPLENMAKIFDPFFTTKANGTGLGLCLARQIVEAHNGFITATSEPGEKTVFTITLDRSASPPRVPRKPRMGKGSADNL